MPKSRSIKAYSNEDAMDKARKKYPDRVITKVAERGRTLKTYTVFSRERKR